MSIEFRRIQQAAAANVQPSQPLSVQLWVPPATKQQAEASLYRFLHALSEGQLQTGEPLLLDNKVLQALYADPHPAVVEVLGRCLELFLLEIDPDPARWKKFELSTTILGVALTAYNCLCASMVRTLPPVLAGQEVQVEDPVNSFLAALIETIPPARTLADLLAYHVLLRPLAETLPTLPEQRARLVDALINRSPLSSLCYLHLSTPSPLPVLGRELLPWWKTRTVDPAPWASFDDWLRGPVLLLTQPAIATYLRRRWLSLPETHRACRNLGLLLEGLRLEGLRRKDHLREFILEFYGAYDFFCAKKVENSSRDHMRYWPLLQQIEELVHVQSIDESNIPLNLNRLGSEYFLKFCALINIIIAEKGKPKDYDRPKIDFIVAIEQLFPYTIFGYNIARSEQSSIQFFSEDQS